MMQSIVLRRTFSTSLVTASWIGYEMNSECFLTMSLIFFSSKYSLILLKVETDLGTTAKRRIDGVNGDDESATNS